MAGGGFAGVVGAGAGVGSGTLLRLAFFRKPIGMSPTSACPAAALVLVSA